MSRTWAGSRSDRRAPPRAHGRARHADRPDDGAGISSTSTRAEADRGARDERRRIGPPPVPWRIVLPDLRPQPSPVTAVMLSMLIPGAGHIYWAAPGAGVAWMATTLMGYACCFLPGLFLHGLCLVSAAQTRRAESLRRAAPRPSASALLRPSAASAMRSFAPLEALFLALAQLAELIERALNRGRLPFGRRLEQRRRAVDHAHVLFDPARESPGASRGTPSRNPAARRPCAGSPGAGPNRLSRTRPKSGDLVQRAGDLVRDQDADAADRQHQHEAESDDAP